MTTQPNAELREEQLQGQLHEVSIAMAEYEADPTNIGNYLRDRKELLWKGLAEHQAKSVIQNKLEGLS